MLFLTELTRLGESTIGTGAFCIEDSGGRGEQLQSSLVYSPFVSPYRYSAVAKVFEVKVEALPPPPKLASVADTFTETGSLTFEQAIGRRRAAVISSSCTYCGILRLHPSGKLSVCMYVWWNMLMHSRRCIKGCTNSPISFCKAFFVAYRCKTSWEVSSSICLSFFSGQPTLRHFCAPCFESVLFFKSLLFRPRQP